PKSATFGNRAMSARQVGVTALFGAFASTLWRNCLHQRFGDLAVSKNTIARRTPMIGACARRMTVPTRSRRLTVAYRWRSRRNCRSSGTRARAGDLFSLGVPGWRVPEYIEDATGLSGW